MNEQSSMSGRPDVRVGDRDRDEVLALLSASLGEGRLTLVEFSDRQDAALTAVVQADLDVLTSDLPVPHQANGRAVNVRTRSHGSTWLRRAAAPTAMLATAIVADSSLDAGSNVPELLFLGAAACVGQWVVRAGTHTMRALRQV
jgi:CheY-like chemotaxis protein